MVVVRLTVKVKTGECEEEEMEDGSGEKGLRLSWFNFKEDSRRTAIAATNACEPGSASRHRVSFKFGVLPLPYSWTVWLGVLVKKSKNEEKNIWKTI